MPPSTKKSTKQITPAQPAADNHRRGLRIAEAAAYAGLTVWFIERKIRSGELPAFKLCRHWTILREDLDALLDAAKRKAAV